MFTSIARIALFVHDYDDALAFYRDVLGFEVLFDAEVDARGRFLHVGLPSQPGVGLWLRQARTDAERALVGKQAAGEPFLVLYTDDCRAAVATLEQRGARVRRQPVEDAGSIAAHIEDLYGNEIVIAELLDD